MKDRTFAMGPTVMSKLLEHFEMTGDILQTHVESPQSIAYLASLFYSIDRIRTFHVCGAGPDYANYSNYLKALQVSNVVLYAEPFNGYVLHYQRFVNVIGIFVNAPNSCSGLDNPIDLACCRNGDLKLLESLTEVNVLESSRQRIFASLKEQMVTLRMAMSRAQVQFLLYLTYSHLKIENETMIEYTLKLVNGMAYEKHLKLLSESKKRTEGVRDNVADISSSLFRKRTQYTINEVNNSLQTTSTNSTTADGQQPTELFKLPEIDEFIITNLSHVNGLDEKEYGLSDSLSKCFLRLIQRRFITRLNAKYLIRMAEQRGLFGNTKMTASNKSKSNDLVEQRDKDANNTPSPLPRNRKQETLKAKGKRTLNKIKGSTYKVLFGKRFRSIKCHLNIVLNIEGCSTYMDEFNAQ